MPYDPAHDVAADRSRIEEGEQPEHRQLRKAQYDELAPCLLAARVVEAHQQVEAEPCTGAIAKARFAPRCDRRRASRLVQQLRHATSRQPSPIGGGGVDRQVRAGRVDQRDPRFAYRRRRARNCCCKASGSISNALAEVSPAVVRAGADTI